MGYDIHITRKEHWSDEDDSNEIKLNEWTDYIQSDKERELVDQASATTADGELVIHENPGLAVWTAYSRNGIDENYVWFDFRSGNVIVKNPDEEIIQKMIKISDHLHAKVQGDDGEVYEMKVLKKQGKAAMKEEHPWWKFWR